MANKILSKTRVCVCFLIFLEILTYSFPRLVFELKTGVMSFYNDIWTVGIFQNSSGHTSEQLGIFQDDS